MGRLATKEGETPYSIPNKGPVPKIEQEEGVAPGELNIAWVEDSRKNLYHWSTGLKWYERLHAHATMNSARKNVRCKRPFAPKDELDFVLDAIYSPLKDAFSEKQDVYLQKETAYGEDMNIAIREAREHPPPSGTVKKDPCGTGRAGKAGAGRRENEGETWRLLRNRFVVYPDKSLARGHPLLKGGDEADGEGRRQRRENIYNVKLGIAADHSPQTNPGYSRTPSGAFYAI